MKSITLFFGALALFLTGCATPTERDQQAIVGTWRVVRVEENGELDKRAIDEIKRGESKGDPWGFRFLENGTFTASISRAKTAAGTYELDAKKDPKWLTLTLEGRDRPVFAIYHLEGDELCIGASAREHEIARPATLSGKGIMSFTLQREKP